MLTGRSADMVNSTVSACISSGFGVTVRFCSLAFLIIWLKVFSNAEVVVDFGGDSLRDRNQSVFSELGILYVQGPIIPAIMPHHEPERLLDPHTTSSQEQQDQVCP